jgi:hypothetical protein
MSAQLEQLPSVSTILVQVGKDDNGNAIYKEAIIEIPAEQVTGLGDISAQWKPIPGNE